MKKLFTILLSTFITISYSQDAFELSSELELTAMDIEMNLEDISYSYTDYFDCLNEEAVYIPGDYESAKKFSLNTIRSKFAEIRKSVGRVSKINAKFIKITANQAPYFTRRYFRLDSLFRSSQSLLNRKLAELRQLETEWISYVDNNFCKEELLEFTHAFIFESDKEVQSIVEALAMESESYWNYDEKPLLKLLKKYKITWINMPDEFDPEETIVFLGKTETTGELGLIQLQSTKSYWLAKPLYDSVIYSMDVEYAFAWKDEKATFIYTPYF